MKYVWEYLIQKYWFRLFLVLAASWCTLCFYFHNYMLWTIFSAAALAFSIYLQRKYYLRHIKKILFLLEAIENHDNSFHFPEEKSHGEDLLINQSINRVGHILYKVKAETAQQEKYYEKILNVVNTGILVLNENGAVYQKNNEIMRLLGLEVPTHLRQLEPISKELMEKLMACKGGDKFQITIHNERGTLYLSGRVSEIRIRNEALRILAMNDINNELNEKEIDSWIRLTRVLTHEIMNSVTPITSLSETLLNRSHTENEEIRQGLQTISSTGKGLLTFVESYRKFTRIPTPEPSLFYVKGFAERMTELARHQEPCSHIIIRTQVTPSDLLLYADENLVAQVVINILKNAIQAIGTQPDGKIGLSAYSNKQEEVILEITNNGPPIPEEIANHIFVPFFTTKAGGSDIGLSVSRQIMRLSGGSIELHSGKETRFVLKFK